MRITSVWVITVKTGGLRGDREEEERSVRSYDKSLPGCGRHTDLQWVCGMALPSWPRDPTKVPQVMVTAPNPLLRYTNHIHVTGFPKSLAQLINAVSLKFSFCHSLQPAQGQKTRREVPSTITASQNPCPLSFNFSSLSLFELLSLKTYLSRY